MWILGYPIKYAGWKHQDVKKMLKKKKVLLEYSSLLFGYVNGPDENSTVISNAQFLRIWHNVWDLQPTLVTTKLYTVKKNNIHFCFTN